MTQVYNQRSVVYDHQTTMASTTQFLSQATPCHPKLFHRNDTFQIPPLPFHSFPLTQVKHPLTLTKCTSQNSSPAPVQPPLPDSSSFPTPETVATTPPDLFPIEKRRRSEIIRDRKSQTGLVKPEPPNFEVGWKRTKPVLPEKPTGYVIMDFLEKLEGLMARDFGSTELLAKAGEIIAERAIEEAEVLLEEGKVEDRMVTELSRVLKLMEMDLAMVKAAVKEETLAERLQQAMARCRQAILVASSF